VTQLKRQVKKVEWLRKARAFRLANPVEALTTEHGFFVLVRYGEQVGAYRLEAVGNTIHGRIHALTVHGVDCGYDRFAKDGNRNALQTNLLANGIVEVDDC